MKTNQMMEVSIGGFTLPIGHKTQMGSLNALWSYGVRHVCLKNCYKTIQ